MQNITHMYLTVIEDLPENNTVQYKQGQVLKC